MKGTSNELLGCPWYFFGVSIGFNSFLANVTILYPLKTSINQMFHGVFRDYRMGTWARNGLIYNL